jgi:hypothetical protein
VLAAPIAWFFWFLSPFRPYTLRRAYADLPTVLTIVQYDGTHPIPPQYSSTPSPSQLLPSLVMQQNLHLTQLSSPSGSWGRSRRPPSPLTACRASTGTVRRDAQIPTAAPVCTLIASDDYSMTAIPGLRLIVNMKPGVTPYLWVSG